MGLALCGLLACQPDTNTSGAWTYSSAFERVRTTGILRCGYAVWASGFMKDEKTGAFTGLMVDFMEEVGRLANVKITWDHEVDWGLMQQEFESQKIDAMCAGDWVQAHKLRQVYYSNALAYDTVLTIVRVDDNRFDGNLALANASNITVCAIENDASDLLAKEIFPTAKRLYVAPMDSEQGCLLSVKTKKADLALVSQTTATEYINNNPGSLKAVLNVKPIGVYPLGIPVAHGDNDMVQLFNVAIAEMQASGFLDRLIDKYQRLYPASLYKLSERDRISR